MEGKGGNYKTELQNDPETPIEIKDYTAINLWEKLISDIDKILAKIKYSSTSNIKNSTPKSNINKSYEINETTKLIYVSLVREIKKSRNDLYVRYYGRALCDLLALSEFPALDVSLCDTPELISTYFGLTEFILLEAKKRFEEEEQVNITLSALQVAVEDSL